MFANNSNFIKFKLIATEEGYDFSKYGRINYLLERRINLLEEVKKLNTLLTSTINDYTCETAGLFFKH